MNQQFRPAQAAEFETICDLYSCAVAHMRAQGIDQWDERYPVPEDLRRDILRGEMYLLEADGRPAAAVVLNDEQDADYQTADWRDAAGKPAVVHRLCVRPDVQGRGIARRVMEHAHAALCRDGYTSVRLDAFSQNPAALALYAGLGYRKTGKAVWRKGLFYLFEVLLAQAPENRYREDRL